LTGGRWLVLICSERSTLIAGGWFVLREKYCWLVADKPNEQADLLRHIFQNDMHVTNQFSFSFAIFSTRSLGIRATPTVWQINLTSI
jgi:hypothetical protein